MWQDNSGGGGGGGGGGVSLVTPAASESGKINCVSYFLTRCHSSFLTA